MKLIKNEFIKVFKRKNIYILLVIGVLLITGYNLFSKLSIPSIDIQTQYQRAYNNDRLILENYNQLNIKEKYEDVVERMKLEEYAIENDIQYNILLNSENNNAILPTDARISLMKVFNNFDIIIIFIIIFLSSTTISEEYNNGTIKNLLTKPHKRIQVLFSKVIASTLITLFVVIFIVLLQYVFGGILYGFDSYTLDAIRYDKLTQEIETMNLAKYIILIVLAKMPMYLILIIFSMLFATISNNIALNILISLGLYILSNANFLINNISKYIFIYNWDISKYLFTSTSIVQHLAISGVSLSLIGILLFIIFKNKDIVNE